MRTALNGEHSLPNVQTAFENACWGNPASLQVFPIKTCMICYRCLYPLFVRILAILSMLRSVSSKTEQKLHLIVLTVLVPSFPI